MPVECEDVCQCKRLGVSKVLKSSFHSFFLSTFYLSSPPPPLSLPLSPPPLSSLSFPLYIYIFVGRYAHENGCAWDARTCAQAALRGDISSLRCEERRERGRGESEGGERREVQER